MAKKQIEFPPNQTHDKRFEMAMLGLSVVFIILVIIAIETVSGGTL